MSHYITHHADGSASIRQKVTVVIEYEFIPTEDPDSQSNVDRIHELSYEELAIVSRIVTENSLSTAQQMLNERATWATLKFHNIETNLLKEGEQ